MDYRAAEGLWKKSGKMGAKAVTILDFTQKWK